MAEKSKKMSNCEKQVERMSEDLQKLDPNQPNYTLWMRLTTFLGSLCEALSDLQVAVRGDGNGTRGLLDRMTTIEGDMKSTKSDVREVLNTMRSVYGMDKDEISSRFDEKNHPNRRASDQTEDDLANKVLIYFVNRILPQIIVWLVLGWAAFQIAVNQHLIMQG